MNQDAPAYGFWGVAIINAAVVLVFAWSFAKPKTTRDWRTFGGFTAFVVALFAEMYGFPLTIYLLSGWLQARFPGTDFLTHDAGHVWYDLLGLGGDPHANPLHIASNLIIVSGFFLLWAAWRVLYKAQQAGSLATTGPYAHIRHPQYLAFIAIMAGFLLQWPTLLTLLMFPVLVTMYVRLAHREEADAARVFGIAWEAYAAATPRWLPRLLRTDGTSPLEGRR